MSHTEVLKAYGLFMVTWSVLESLLEVAIKKQLGITEVQTAIVTSSLGFRARSSILSSLLALDGAKQNGAISLLNKISEDAKRNTLVHGHIFVGEEEKLTFVKADISKRYRAKRASFTSSALLRHVQTINSDIANLQTLLRITDQELDSFGKIGFDASAPPQ
jgi:hypothetical protein